MNLKARHEEVSKNYLPITRSNIFASLKGLLIIFLISMLVGCGIFNSKTELEILPPDNKQLGNWEIEIKKAEVVNEVKAKGKTFQPDKGEYIVNFHIDATPIVYKDGTFFNASNDQIQVYLDYSDSLDLIGLSYVDDYRVSNISGMPLLTSHNMKSLNSNFYAFIEKEQFKDLKAGKATMKIFFIEKPSNEDSDYVSYSFTIKK